jgi:phospholipid/cholesterol/gamma-HCH transport system substrate-binding protein
VVDQRRSPSDTTTRDVDLLAHCKIAADHPTAVRGARNLPCPNSTARGPVPRACGLTFGQGRWPVDGGSVARDLATGRVHDNTLDLTRASTDSEGDELWEILVLAPLGLRG